MKNKFMNFLYIRNSFMKMKKANDKIISFFYLAGVEGLEPSQAVLETDVLPLTLYP